MNQQVERSAAYGLGKRGIFSSAGYFVFRDILLITKMLRPSGFERAGHNASSPSSDSTSRPSLNDSGGFVPHIVG